MAKGMSMEEFKNALSSEARIENEELKKKLAKIEEEKDKEISDLKEALSKAEHEKNVLCGRCFVNNKGVLCLNCIISDCEFGYTDDEIIKTIDLFKKKGVIKNSLSDLDADAFIQINNYLMNLRDERLLKSKES